MPNNLQCIAVRFQDVVPWLTGRHYARRICPVSYAFGLYQERSLIGIVTYGVPVSSALRGGVCGAEWADKVLELNRLCCESTKNAASYLIAASLRLLPRPAIVISYADTSVGHIGYVYQATNFLYTGLSAKRTNWTIKGREHLHGATIADETRGESDRVAYMRSKYGDDFYLSPRPRKHRYVYFVGNRRDKKAMLAALRYPVEPYPKGETHRYDASAEIARQDRLFI